MCVTSKGAAMDVPFPANKRKTNDLDAFWMPFTANRQFKEAPRLFVAD